METEVDDLISVRYRGNEIARLHVVELPAKHSTLMLGSGRWRVVSAKGGVCVVAPADEMPTAGGWSERRLVRE